MPNVRRTTAMLSFAVVTTAALLAERPPASQERSARRLVMDDTHQIPPAEWSYAEVLVPRPATLIQSEFEVLPSMPRVRLCLMRAEDLDGYGRERQAACLAATSYGPRGRLVYPGSQGRYALVVENRASKAAAESKVRLRIWLQTVRQAQSLPLWRQSLTIAVSLAVFLLLAAYSARKLLPALKQTT
jgi:hypothetical protein